MCMTDAGGGEDVVRRWVSRLNECELTELVYVAGEGHCDYSNSCRPVFPDGRLASRFSRRRRRSEWMTLELVS